MAKIIEKIAVLNSAARTVIALVVMGGLGAGGWYGYHTYYSKDLTIKKTEKELADIKSELERTSAQLREKDQAIEALNVEVAHKQKEIERLDTALRLLKVDRRVARLSVLDQAHDAETGNLMSLIEFQELNEEGAPVDAPRQFRIEGDVVYVDAWVVKFDDKYVEQADIDRSTSLVLFRRIFGERQKPMEGFAIDQAGSRPTVYARAGQMSDLEKKIWGDFWSVANDETKQAELGIRAAHGEAPSLKVQKGRSYLLELRASGGLSIDGEPVKPPKPAA